MATNDTTYNGWTNYETWAVNLWLSNDEGLYNYWREQAGNVWALISARKDRHGAPLTPDSSDARGELSELLKAEIENEAPELVGLYADLLTAAISSVDWFELADSWLDGAELTGYVSLTTAQKRARHA